MADTGKIVSLIKSIFGKELTDVKNKIEGMATATASDITQIKKETTIKSGFQYEDMINAVWSTTTKEINTNYKYGLSNINKILIGETGTIKVKCNGYYIRAFRFSKTGTDGTDWTDYVADEITINGTQSLIYGAFIIRKTASSQNDLTSEEITDILSKLTIEKCASVAITECMQEISGAIVEKDVTPEEWQNSIYSSTTGKLLPVQNAYKYGLSNRIKLPIRLKAKIICEGYYIRVFRFSADSTSFDYLGYAKDAITIEPTATLSIFGFVIRKDPNNSSNLTDLEIEDIKSKVSVKIQSTITDDTMKEIGIPADACSVGVILNDATNNNCIIGRPSIYFSTNPQQEDYENTDFWDVYDAYDALCVLYPNWIQKQTDIGTDADGNPIKLYKLRLFNPIVGESDAWSLNLETKVNYWESTFKYRKALLCSGVHGNERCAVWGLLYFVTDLLASNDEWATFIKGNYELDIIPIVDPWGYDNKSRNNKNDVNINRDYLSQDKQPETQAVINYIQSIKNDLYCVIDCHATSGNYGYVSAKPENKCFNTIMRVANTMFGAIADDLYTIATSIGISSDYYPYMYGCMSENDGTLNHYCAINEDITNYAITLETPNRSGTDGGLVTKYINEGLGNLLQSFLSIFKIV